MITVWASIEGNKILLERDRDGEALMDKKKRRTVIKKKDNGWGIDQKLQKVIRKGLSKKIRRMA